MAPNDDSLVRKFSDGYFSQDEPNTFVESFDDVNNIADDDVDRVFANQPLDMAKIKCFGFDMDYTLAEYISPEFDFLGCRLTQEWMVDHLNYPRSILDIKYDPCFPVRGLWFDRNLGNLLKVNQFGKILQCFHGYKQLNPTEIEQLYPGSVQKKDNKRIFIMNTLFNLAETHLVAALIDYFDNQEHFRQTNDGWVEHVEHEEHSNPENYLTFKQLFQDVRTAVDDIHLRSMKLKTTVMEEPQKYIRRDSRLSPLLTGLRVSGKKPFLVTNSDWRYTNCVMTHLLGDHWDSFFDLIIVDACKPRFFEEGTPMKIVDKNSGNISNDATLIAENKIFSGGNSDQVLSKLEASGHEVLYCGDHLHADIIKCRKLTSWKTILIIPELEKELSVRQGDLLSHISKLDSLLAKNPKLTDIRCRLQEAIDQFDKKFSSCGSLFRSGHELSYFGAMVKNWSELYTSSVGNLLAYGFDTRFVPHLNSLPHE